MSIVILLPGTGFAQRLGFVTSTPRIDSFPIVRLKMTATYNGSLPQPGIQPNNLKITEDNAPVNNFQLLGCDESGQAAVVFCVDASTSIRSSAGDSWFPYRAYFSSFDSFVTAIPAASRYALVAFTDSLFYYPGVGHPNGFYSGKNAVDSADFENAVYAQPFVGFTNVDNAVNFSAGLLQYQPYQQKAIVLVTDDAIINTPYFDSLLNAWGITLYVMEMGNGSPVLNSDVTHATGGVFMTATDSSQFAPVMSQIAEYVFGEHCLIRYPSTNPCPWLKLHDISLTLDYNSLSKNVNEQYILGRNIFDVDPPLFSVSSPVYISRIVQATENFPCTRGMRDFTDSLLDNFIKLSQIRNLPNFASDSLVVSDSLQPARAVYTATDSVRNHGIKEILYVPRPDTLSPVITVSQSFSGSYEMFITEDRPWDRGIKTINMNAGAVNFVLDSFQITSRHFATAWLHTPVPSAAGSGCLLAFDSVGNVASYCIKRDSATGDTLAPIITQDPIASPRQLITGTVTEERYKDIGIKNITIFPNPNTGASQINFLSSKRAIFSVPIIDSLQPVRTPITASDSIGNAVRDTLRYDPLPDNFAPVCSVESPNQKTRIFHVTELAPWDRGISSVTLIGASVNLTVGPVIYSSVYQAQQQFTVIDPFSQASAIIQAFDSAGHHCETTISIDPLSRPLIPFTAIATVDFGIEYAPADSTKQIQITNPNGSPVIVTKVTQTGDAVFSSDMAGPIIFQPLEQKTFNIRFQPAMLGVWQGDFALANDTMPLTSVHAIGRTIGSVRITIDTVQVPKSQMASSFSIAISAIPAPINLDSISFTLNYDADLAELNLQNLTDCQSANNPLCNYAMSVTPLSYGKLQFQFIRNNKNLPNILDFAASKFDIPFICYVSQRDSTSLQLENLSVSQQSTASYAPGRISVLSECGDQSLRAQLNNNLAVWLQSIVPNPASGNVSVSILAKEKGNAEIAIIDHLGEVKLRNSVSLLAGSNSKAVDLSKLPSGSYQLILSSSGGNISSRLLQIMR